ncbi:jg20318, partial [Pararge aegeria aegeria]
MKHYLCDISYGTPANALKNVAFVDTRPAFLLPNCWSFYYSERLFLLKLLQYIIEFKNDVNYKYSKEFTKIIDDIGVGNLKTSLITQFEKVIFSTPPPRKIQSDFGSDSVRQEWAESNLKEQLVILQTLMLIANEYTFTESEFTDLFSLFKKHYFGKNQGYNDFLEEQHREACLRVMYMEVGLFTVILEYHKIKNVPAWIDKTKEIVETELTKLEPHAEHSLMLIVWMMLTLQ